MSTASVTAQQEKMKSAAVNYATASLKLEGREPDQEYLAMCDRVVRGEFTQETLITAVNMTATAAGMGDHITLEDALVKIRKKL